MLSKKQLFTRGMFDISPHMLSVIPFGIICGAIGVELGFDPYLVYAMSFIIFGGASQIVFLQLLSGGASSLVAVASVGILLAWIFYIKKSLSADAWSKRLGFLYHWSQGKYYFDENYNNYLYQPTLRLAKKIAWIDWELYDKYFINGFGKVTNLASKVTGKFDYEAIDQVLVDGTAKIANVLGRFLRTVQTGKLQNYVLYVTCGLIILMIIQTF